MEQLSRFPSAKHCTDLPFEGTFLVDQIPWSSQYCSSSVPEQFCVPTASLKGKEGLRKGCDSQGKNTLGWATIAKVDGK